VKKGPIRAELAASTPAQGAQKTEVTITPAKGRPMLTWVGKQPLSHMTAFPAQQVETFSPLSGNLGYRVGSSDHKM
jgi:hypothetical protein